GRLRCGCRGLECGASGKSSLLPAIALGRNPFQEHDMKTLSDIALPQIGVLDSAMAYREAGSPGVSPFGQNTRAILWLRLSSMMNVLPCAIDSTGHACCHL